VPSRPQEIELSVERPLGPDGPAGGVARLTVRFAPGPDGEGPAPSELAEALDRLKADLEAVVGLPLAGAPIRTSDRDLDELVVTYRPRQRELVDLLREEGQLTPGEHARLLEYLSGPPWAPAPAPPEPPAPAPRAPVERPPPPPIAAVPIVAERTPDVGRPVADLLREYDISSLRQAGAVRARREISFGEYMALKRHFEKLEEGGAPAAGEGRR